MTSDTTRAELLKALADLGRVYPRWRLGQTLANLATAAGRIESGGVRDLEDAEALEAARRLLERRTEREPARA